MKTQNTNPKFMRKLFSIVLLFIGIVVNAQILSFADANLKAKLLSNDVATDIFGNPIIIDTNGNGEIELSEALLVPNLNLNAANISSLDGITSFTNLQSLQVNDNLLTTVDISGMTSLLTFSARNNQLTSIAISALPNLYYLDVGTNQLTTLDLSGIPALEWFVCKTNLLTSLDVSAHTSVSNIECDGNLLTSLNVQGCSALRSLVCNNNSLPSLNITGLGELRSLSCHYNQISSIDLTGLSNLQTLYCASNQLSSLNLSGLTSLITVGCGNNTITSLDCTTSPLLENLYCDHNQLNSLNVAGLSNLKNLVCINNLLTTLDLNNLTSLLILYCQNNILTSLDTSDLNSITSLHCFSNNLTSLTVNNLNSLQYLYCWNNQLTSLTVTNNAQLKQLYCYVNQLTTINISNLPVIDSLGINNNQLTSLDLSGFPSLISITCQNNLLTSLNLSGVNLIEQLTCDNNQLTTLDMTNQPNLQILSCIGNQITTLDISDSHNFCYLTCDNNPLLETVFMKTGSMACPIIEHTFINCPNLSYICTDEWRIDILNNYFAVNSMNVVVNTYCSYSPGGNYNTITGQIKYDANNNGCDASDLPQPNIRININDGTNQGATFTNDTGNYGFYTQAGSFDLNLDVENPTWFTFTPNSATIPFADNNNNTATQDFCIAPNGNHTDVEMVIMPITPARPGFEATYKLVYKNKGNQTRPVFLNFSYDDTVLDFVGASVAPGLTSSGHLSWTVMDLQPFQSGYVLITFHLNSPSDTPPVNIGDELTFTSFIDVTADENWEDNAFTLHQTVVGSFDPNEITCLEGDMLPVTEIGKYLHYGVTFENTGNYPAENVVVKDVIDTDKYDINSLQVLETSHPSYIKITGNTVEFIFENINLAAASGGPPVGGHGDVLFKIKSKNTLVNGDYVSKSAKIYFDYNAPIMTNDALTTFATLNNPIHHFDNSVKVYPNPAHSLINISCDATIESVSLYDVQGRLLETDLTNSNEVSFDISGKSNGIYFIKITSDKGSKVEKVVKE
jgi:Leucine-rich repeat (LRR) protein